MAVFVDTCVFIAVRNSRDVNHSRAVELMREILKGAYGVAYYSDYVFDEAVTVALALTGRPEIAIDVGNFMLASPRLKMLTVDRTAFKRAWEIFRELAHKRLSFTDAISVALMERYKIGYIASFDKHFDGIVPRIC